MFNPRFRGSHQPVIVLGMYRSGTSCVARCIHELGYFLGEPGQLFPADSFNPGGYYEIEEFMELNRRVMTFFGMHHFRPVELGPDWFSMPNADLLVEDVARAVKRLFEGHDRWGWKEPQATPLLPVYERVFSDLGLDPVYVICLRNPLDVLGSQVTHSHLPAIGESGVGLWLHYTLTALRHSKGRRRIVIPYERLLTDPHPYLTRLGSLAPGASFTPEEYASAAATVHPEWRQNKVDEGGLASWPAIVRDTLDLGRKCADQHEEFVSGGFDDEIDALWLAWRRQREMVATSAIPEGTANFLDEGTEEVTSPVVFRPTGTWQTLVLEILPTSSPSLLLDLYQMPSVVWIRNARMELAGELFQAELAATAHGQLRDDGGIFKLTQWGWYPLSVKVPRANASGKLTLEVFIQWNVYAVEDAVNTLRNRVSAYLHQG